MSKANIHPTAIIEAGAQIADDVIIEPYAIVKKNVTLEKGVVIKAHAYIDGYTTIGEGTVIFPSASIGTKTQDRKYKGEKTFVKIGKNCEIREFVTINSSTGENETVQIGDHCLIMAYCHVAHNCVVGNRVIMSNNATLAGHVTIEDCAIIGGMTGVHQFSRIGTYSMVGGMSRVIHDIPPYTIGGGIPYKFGGINIIGLKRHGFQLPIRQELSKAFKMLYRSGMTLDESLKTIDRELQRFPEIMHFLNFCRTTKRGLTGLHEEGQSDQLEDVENDSHILASS